MIREDLKARAETERRRQELEQQKAEADVQQQRRRDYVRITLSLLILPICLFILVHRKTTAKQKTIAASLAGALVAFWFATPK